MKFVCNNCGFSAEIPEKRSNCPMCASNNVTVMEEDAVKQTKQDLEQKTEEFSEKAPENVGVLDEKEDVRKEKITLTDNFFDQKPNKEEQEIADVIKELYPEEEKKGSGFTLPDWKILAGIGAAVVILIVITVVAMSSGNSEEEGFTEVEDVEDVEEKEAEAETEEVVKEEPSKVEEEEAVAEVEEKEPEEQDPEEETIEEKEAVVENKPEKVVEKENPVVRKKPVVKKTPAPKKKVAKKTTSPKMKKVNAGPKFNDFVQAGHAALGEKRYTDALHEYKNAMRLSPGNGKIYKFIGIAYAYLQNQNQACKNYRKYIELTPNAKDKAQVQAFLEACQ